MASETETKISSEPETIDSSIKIEPKDEDDIMFCYGHRFNNLLKEDFEKYVEEARLDFWHIKLYIKQTELKEIGKILFKNDINFPHSHDTFVSPKQLTIIIKIITRLNRLPINK